MSEDYKLTKYIKCSGWAGKAGPEDLSHIAKELTQPRDKNYLVGFENSDDAGVYKIDENLYSVTSVDFITPVVDDPFIYGQIAVANSISDIYAMRAKPSQALNLLMWDRVHNSEKAIREILKGGLNKIDEADVRLMGGHSIDDVEQKYGLSVTGYISDGVIWKNCSAKVGDKLILTKPIGSGVLTTALKADLISENHKEQVIETMRTLNRKAYEIGKKYAVNGCTDVTGFGLLGHLNEMCRDLSVRLDSSKVPILDGVFDTIDMGIVPAGTYANRNYLEPFINYRNIDDKLKIVLCDAQTSGGLLFAVSSEDSQKLLSELNRYLNAYEIGEFTQKGDFKIEVF